MALLIRRKKKAKGDLSVDRIQILFVFSVNPSTQTVWTCIGSPQTHGVFRRGALGGAQVYAKSLCRARLAKEALLQAPALESRSVWLLG